MQHHLLQSGLQSHQQQQQQPSQAQAPSQQQPQYMGQAQSQAPPPQKYPYNDKPDREDKIQLVLKENSRLLELVRSQQKEIDSLKANNEIVTLRPDTPNLGERDGG